MKSFWKWLKQYTILYNLVIIGLLFLGLAIAAFVVMAIGTRHSARRTVPDFIGLRMNDAEYFADRRDLRIIVNDSLYVPAYPGGVVLDQLPKGGVVVKPGRKVYVTINSSKQRMVAVPYVAGRSLRQAKNMLETAGLTIEYMEYVSDIATNYVLAEYVNGEEVTEESEIKAEKGSGVVLRVGVAEGDSETTVPMVVGRTLHEAKSRLWESGFNIGEIEFEEGIPMLERNRAKVYNQSSVVGTQLPYGSRVSIRLTLDAERIAAAVEESEQEIERQLQEKMRADSVERAEKRLLDSLSAVKATQQTPVKTEEDNFFF